MPRPTDQSAIDARSASHPQRSAIDARSAGNPQPSAIDARSASHSQQSAIDTRSASNPQQSAITGAAAIHNQSATRNPQSAIGKPLLKWAGGKRQLLPALRTFYPGAFGNYHEPFAGSGAVFFDLAGAGRLAGRRARLTDSNADLIGCYRAVRDTPGDVLRELQRLATGHAADGRDHFYAVREQFNAARAALDGTGAGYTPRLAAMLLYLNRTGFNGLFRLNARGRFNVPVGRYARPRIHDPALVTAVARALGAPGVTIEVAPFDSVLEAAAPGDLIYFDPPYAPVSATARFTAYTAPPFGLDDHARLRDCAVALARRGCHVLVSNSSAPAIEAMYTEPAVSAAGLGLHRVPARRAINSRGSARGPVIELLLTNVPRAPKR
jgi:DNA adenine methylase